MIKYIISRLFRPRHYWRTVSFDAIADLYASRLMTVFAINIINLFAAVYMYQLGYSIIFIALLYAAVFALNIPISYIAARYASFFGLRRGILTANVLRIPSLLAFAMAPQWGVPAVITFAVLQQAAAAFYGVCYWGEFSKLKNPKKAGKEIGTMQIIEKTAKILSPLAGGAIATIWGPHVTVIVASVIFMLAAVPLFQTVEPEPTRSRFVFEGFPWRLSWRSLIGQSVVGVDYVTATFAWTLFVATFVFAGIGDGVYAALGGVAALGVLASMGAAWAFGKIVDKNRDKELLKVGAISNTIIHLARPFISTPVGVAGTNMVHEVAVTGYVIPLTREFLDIADSSGHRIAYAMMLEIVLFGMASIAMLIMALAVWLAGDMLGLQITFAFAAVFSTLLIFVKPLHRD